MFSQTMEYALRAMTFLASVEGESAPSERIAAATRIPGGYLSKIMRDLVVAELVTSQRGRGGGFTLAQPASQLSILAVLNAVDPIRRIKKCPLGNPSHLQLCPLHQRLDNAMAQVEASLGTTMLSELLSTGGIPGRCAGVSTPAVVAISTPASP